MSNHENAPANIPDSTAVRVALWRALHTEIDAVPHVLEDTVGLKLINPPENWRERPDMNPDWTRGYRASIVGRARFIEDLVIQKSNQGIGQYIILGAGLDTFAQREPKIAHQIQIFEIDKPDTQAWKKKRLAEIGLNIPPTLHFVPVNFESGDLWWEKVAQAGFDTKKPTIISSTGVAMYLTKETNMATLRQIAQFSPGTTLAMTIMLPLDLLDPAEQPQHKAVHERARAAGTPFLSFYRPDEIVTLAKEAGFKSAEFVSHEDIIKKYFSGRTDGLKPSKGEAFLIATT